jgi:hypothetical protein
VPGALRRRARRRNPGPRPARPDLRAHRDRRRRGHRHGRRPGSRPAREPSMEAARGAGQRVAGADAADRRPVQGGRGPRPSPRSGGLGHRARHGHRHRPAGHHLARR